MKTIKSALEELYSQAFNLGSSHTVPKNTEKIITDPLNDIESIIKEQVIGEDKPLNGDDFTWTEIENRAVLRGQQNKALLKALGRGEK